MCLASWMWYSIWWRCAGTFNVCSGYHVHSKWPERGQHLPPREAVFPLEGLGAESSTAPPACAGRHQRQTLASAPAAASGNRRAGRPPRGGKVTSKFLASVRLLKLVHIQQQMSLHFKIIFIFWFLGELSVMKEIANLKCKLSPRCIQKDKLMYAHYIICILQCLVSCGYLQIKEAC